MLFELQGSVVLAAVLTVLTVVLLNAVGVAAARYPRHPSGSVAKSGILTSQTLRALAKLATTILVPCLSIVSLGSQLNLQTAKEVWPLLAWSFVNVAISYLITRLLAVIANVPFSIRSEFTLGCSFANAVAIPLVMMEVLCAQPQLSEVEGCFELSASLLFVYSVGWSIMFWSLGVLALRGGANDSTAEASVSGIMPSVASVTTFLRCLADPPFIAIIIGLFIGLVQPVQDVFFGNGAPLSFVAGFLSTYGESAVGILTIIMAGSLGKSIRTLLPPALQRCTSRTSSNDVSAKPSSAEEEAACIDGPQCTEKMKTTTARPSSEGTAKVAPITQEEEISGYITVGVGGVGDLTCPADSTSASASPEGSFSIDLDLALSDTSTEVDLNAAREASTGEQELDSLPTWSRRHTILFVVTKMVVLPAILFVITVYGALPFFTGPKAKLGRLCLLLQTFTPTANVMVAVLQREGRIAAANATARAVLYQYLVAVVTLPVFTAAALGVVFAE